MNFSRTILLLIALLALAACAPQATPTSPGAVSPDAASLDSPAALATHETARIAYHRMEIGRLQTGAYTTNVLIDLDIPRGVRWTVLEFAEDSYLLRFTNDAVPSTAWLVDPGGVRVTQATDD